MLSGADDLASAFARFEAFRKPRVSRLIRESAKFGRIVNLRPAALSGAASLATALVPEAVLTRRSLHHTATARNLAAATMTQLRGAVAPRVPKAIPASRYRQHRQVSSWRECEGLTAEPD